jgi:hypothetical protein
MVDQGDIRDATLGARPGGAPTPAGDLSGGRVPVGATHAQAGVTRSQAIQQVVDEHTASLEELARDHLEGLGHRVHVDIADDAAEAIVALADELGVDAIAIGTHGRGGIRRALMGSVAEAVIRHSNVPVLVVRHGMQRPAAAE